MARNFHDESVLRELGEGRRIELIVGLALLDAGLTVKVGQLVRREHRRDAWRFAEETDVIVAGHFVIEVKSSSYPFTGVDDFPFDGAYTCTVERWKKRKRKPDAFVIVSTPTQAMITVSPKSFPHWTIHTSRDSRRDDWPTKTYRCPRAYLLSFSVLVTHLQRLERGS